VSDAQLPPGDDAAPEAEPAEPAGSPSRDEAVDPAVGEAADSVSEAEWWDDPNLPWKHKPTRADVVCFTWLSVAAIYGIAISVLRPGLLGTAPQLLAAQGSWSGVVMTGALAATGDRWWPLIWVVASIGFMKFDWVYWWAGRLWGRDLIEVWSGRSARARKINDWAEKFARKYETLALIVNFLPIPLPRAVILAVLGEAGTTLKKFLTVSIIASLVTTGCYLAIGYWIGPPAVDAMTAYGKYLWYVSIALLVGVFANYWWRNRSQSSSDSAAH
jgi:membrane protein DedA with SNARE-associated domain